MRPSGRKARGGSFEGIGIGFIPPLWDRSLVDEIDAVSTDEAMAMARRLAAEEALFVGTSSGANVVAANRVARRLGPGSTTVTIAVDAGAKYLSTDLFAGAASQNVERWVELHAEPDPAVPAPDLG